MKIYQYDDENKTIKIHKDCKKCSQLKICKFHQKASEFAKENIMFQMTKYLEWNNILAIFEYHSSCQYYSPKYKLPEKGESVNLECDPEMINYIIRKEIDEIRIKLLKEKYPEHIGDKYFFFNPDVKINIESDNFYLTLKTTNKEIGHGTIVLDSEFIISKIIDKWFFVN